MSALLDKLTHHAPALWVEVGPPRGINPEPLLRRLSALVGHADAINLTDNALGKVKMSGVAFASIIKLRLGLPVVVNFSCRDRNRFALKALRRLRSLGTPSHRAPKVLAIIMLSPTSTTPPHRSPAPRSPHISDGKPGRMLL